MINDKKLKICIGQSRFEKNWKEQDIKWSDLVNKLKTPIKTKEKIEDFLKLSKQKQDTLKDVGGFVGGTLKDNLRKASNVLTRSIITLDADNIEPGKTNDILKKIENLGCAYCVYSTRKHTGYKPRLRILIPLVNEIKAEEYEPIARKIASFINMEIMDPSTFEASRLMYWPSCSMDSEYVYKYEDKPFADGQGILNMYKNWKDNEEWPKTSSTEKVIISEIKKQKNPIDKEGIVGAFCRVYDINRVIETFLSDVYETGTYAGKYTFINGSVANGAHVYENGNFLYSYHATDPASRQLCNAFDLVRIHKFNDLDEDAKDKTPVTQLPSFKQMCEFALEQEEVKDLLLKEKYISSAKDDFNIEDTEENDDWIKKLKITREGNILKTAENVTVILENDPNLKDKFIYDRFTGRFLITDKVPWYYLEKFKKYSWSDTDEACLRNYIEKVYNLNAPNKIKDALSELKMKKSLHVVQEYFKDLVWDGVSRLETLLIDYLGADDSIYIREVMTKSMVAAVARSYKEEGVKFDTMPILIGPQGIGKSTFLRKLGGEWFTDSITTLEGKDTVITMQKCLIVEIAELAAFGKIENNRLKQMLSSESDLFREPYERESREHPRHCIFWGTTNDSEFLKDATGNRRFWPIVLGVNKAKKSVFNDLDNEIDQIWAEACNLYKNGCKLYLEGDAEKQAKNYQELCREHSPKEGIIQDYLEQKVPADWLKKTLEERRLFNTYEDQKIDLVYKDRICAAEIWCECFNGDIKYMQRKDVKEINDILARIDGWKKVDTSARYGPSYGLQRGYTRIT